MIQDRLDEVRKMGKRRFIPGLVDALKDENYLVRLEAIEWLYRIGDEKTIQPLIEALKDSNSKIRKLAILTLIYIGSEEIIQPLINSSLPMYISVKIAKHLYTLVVRKLSNH